MNWQDYLAIGFFVAAAMYVAWRAWRALFGAAKAGCGSGCGSCASNKPTNLLTIAPGEGDVRPKSQLRSQLGGQEK
jgi:hypothetical protein